MEDMQGIRVLGGQGRGLDGNRQPCGIPIPTQRELQEMEEKLKEQKTLIDTLLAERQGRQIERQFEYCRLMECNLEELRKFRNSNICDASYDRLNHRNPTLKRKIPWVNYQGKGKKIVQTEQQNYSRVSKLLPCSICGNHYPNVRCNRKRVCYKCRKPGHIVADCPEEAAEKRICYKCLESGHVVKDCSDHGRHYQDTSGNKQ
ncbi:hypothetical protein K1719_013481 [Acacia pycnantha]|nr:hypothetical protein K1719_013481 [Acacia pycnantha]